MQGLGYQCDLVEDNPHTLTELRESDLPSESEWKRYFPFPKKTLKALGLKKGMVIADLGCGYGTFAIPAAEIVGKKGRVYAVDLDPKMIDLVSSKSKLRDLKNVIVVVDDITALARSTVIKNNLKSGADFVLLANVMHGTRNKVTFLRSVKSILSRKSPKGSIAVLNWKVAKTPRGPPMKIRPTEEQTVSYLLKAGYHSPSVKQMPPYHYAVTAKA